MTNVKPVRKAVFPVAGLGTRFLPATKSTPKEMLPVVDKPLIQYAVEEAAAAGVETLVFITSRMKHAISDHFDSAYELEQRLERDGKSALLAAARSTLPPGLAALYIPQRETLGLGHAVGCALPVMGDEPFLVSLADDLILNPDAAGCCAQLRAAYERTGASIIAVEPIDDDACDRYGVVSVVAEEDGLLRLDGIVEKPGAADAPSRMGVVGRYLLTPAIFEHLRSLKAGAGGELQLTDAIARLMQTEPVYALPFAGRRFDCGSRAGLVQATLQVALNDDTLRDELWAFIRELQSGN